MSKKAITSLLIIGLAVLAIAGGTLAWFTAQATISPNTFTAGTLKIEAGESWTYGEEGLTNWNPGDCTDKEVTIEVTGSKRAFIRVKITEKWEGIAYEEPATNPNSTWHERNAPNVKWWICDEDDTCVAWPGNPAEWQMIETKDGIYWYYKGMFDPDLSEGHTADGPQKVTVLSRVCLAGEETGDEYQGAIYSLSMNFEAIQVTNEAVNNAWGVYWDEDEKEWKSV